MNCCEFVGERPHKDFRDFYGHADNFSYASLSETYGQVISEAMFENACWVAVAHVARHPPEPALARGLGDKSRMCSDRV